MYNKLTINEVNPETIVKYTTYLLDMGLISTHNNSKGTKLFNYTNTHIYNEDCFIHKIYYNTDGSYTISYYTKTAEDLICNQLQVCDEDIKYKSLNKSFKHSKPYQETLTYNMLNFIGGDVKFIRKDKNTITVIHSDEHKYNQFSTLPVYSVYCVQISGFNIYINYIDIPNKAMDIVKTNIYKVNYSKLITKDNLLPIIHKLIKKNK